MGNGVNTVLKEQSIDYLVNPEGLFEVIRHSLNISRHMEFFIWLQAHVGDYIPHDILVATWGDFKSNRLHYDVTSNVPEIHTKQLSAGCYEIDPLMRDLYKKWSHNDHSWFVLNDFDELIKASNYSGEFIDGLKKMKSILVYGFRDHRSGNDCLYAFFNSRGSYQIQQYVLSMLMPHIDAALRRIECLPASDMDNEKSMLMAEISEREHEVMSWIKHGKSNDDISIILGISPNTVKNHLKKIFKKMNVSTRAQAVALYQSEIESQKSIRGVINESVLVEKMV